MNKIFKKLIAFVLTSSVLFMPIVAFAQEKDNIGRENNEALPNFVQEVKVEPGEIIKIPVTGRIYIGPEYVTIDHGDYIGGRHDYDGNRMGFEVQAVYSDGSTDGSGHNIKFMEASYGSGIPRYFGNYYVDGSNRKVGDNVFIDQNKWYYFQYHNNSYKSIDITIRSYS